MRTTRAVLALVLLSTASLVHHAHATSLRQQMTQDGWLLLEHELLDHLTSYFVQLDKHKGLDLGNRLVAPPVADDAAMLIELDMETKTTGKSSSLQGHHLLHFHKSLRQRVGAELGVRVHGHKGDEVGDSTKKEACRGSLWLEDDPETETASALSGAIGEEDEAEKDASGSNLGSQIGLQVDTLTTLSSEIASAKELDEDTMDSLHTSFPSLQNLVEQDIVDVLQALRDILTFCKFRFHYTLPVLGNVFNPNVLPAAHIFLAQWQNYAVQLFLVVRPAMTLLYDIVLKPVLQLIKHAVRHFFRSAGLMTIAAAIGNQLSGFKSKILGTDPGSGDKSGWTGEENDEETLALQQQGAVASVGGDHIAGVVDLSGEEEQTSTKLITSDTSRSVLERCTTCTLGIIVGIGITITKIMAALTLGLSWTMMKIVLFTWPTQITWSGLYAGCSPCRKAIAAAFSIDRNVERKYFGETCNPHSVGMCMLLAKADSCEATHAGFPKHAGLPAGHPVVELLKKPKENGLRRKVRRGVKRLKKGAKGLARAIFGTKKKKRRRLLYFHRKRSAGSDNRDKEGQQEKAIEDEDGEVSGDGTSGLVDNNSKGKGKGKKKTTADVPPVEVEANENETPVPEAEDEDEEAPRQGSGLGHRMGGAFLFKYRRTPHHLCVALEGATVSLKRDGQGQIVCGEQDGDDVAEVLSLGEGCEIVRNEMHKMRDLGSHPKKCPLYRHGAPEKLLADCLHTFGCRDDALAVVATGGHQIATGNEIGRVIKKEMEEIFTPGMVVSDGTSVRAVNRIMGAIQNMAGDVQVASAVQAAQRAQQCTRKWTTSAERVFARDIWEDGCFNFRDADEKDTDFPEALSTILSAAPKCKSDAQEQCLKGHTFLRIARAFGLGGTSDVCTAEALDQEVGEPSRLEDIANRATCLAKLQKLETLKTAMKVACEKANEVCVAKAAETTAAATTTAQKVAAGQESSSCYDDLLLCSARVRVQISTKTERVIRAAQGDSSAAEPEAKWQSAAKKARSLRRAVSLDSYDQVDTATPRKFSTAADADGGSPPSSDGSGEGEASTKKQGKLKKGAKQLRKLRRAFSWT